jgi:ribosomal protein S18 acetylase RimI-like enzyme
MRIAAAVNSDLEKAVACLAAAFAQDPITSFLLRPGSDYPGRLTRFFSLLMRARLALEMPVLVARSASGIHGAAMGYSVAPPAWPVDMAEEWAFFEKSVPGLADRMAAYDEIAESSKPAEPHYYLGVIGVDPDRHGLGIGNELLRSFCELSAADPLSDGVYLETAKSSNVLFYERAGFRETGRGRLGSDTLWCMFRRHRRRDDA